ncbi:MAG: hypothetical protein V4726_24825 [Verrucomicrobiota bacterium]
MASFSGAASLSALSAFGGGDGFMLPADYGGSDTGNSERMIAYNQTTGNLLMVSRNGGNAVRIYNSSTGALLSTLAAPAGGYASATLNINAIGITTDGRIAVTNLAVGGQTLSVYSWASESAASASVVTSTYVVPAGLRLGDSMDGIGSGANAQFVLGYQSPTAGTAGGDGFAIVPAVSLTAGAFSPVNVDPAAGSADSAFRLSATFIDADTVLGDQNGVARIADFSGTGATVSPLTLSGATERHLDVITIGGAQYLATLDSVTSKNTVRVYELNGTTATLLATSNLIGAGVTNTNGTGDIEWGQVTGDSATLYALNTNNGLQAFTFTVPEPSAAGLALLGACAFLRPRRR